MATSKTPKPIPATKKASSTPWLTKKVDVKPKDTARVAIKEKVTSVPAPSKTAPTTKPAATKKLTAAPVPSKSAARAAPAATTKKTNEPGVGKSAATSKKITTKIQSPKTASSQTTVAKASADAPRDQVSIGKNVGDGTPERPWVLKTPPQTVELMVYRDPGASPPALVCQVGKTQLRYHLRCLEDLHAMLKRHGDWMALGSADEGKPVASGTVEEWGRAGSNPVRGYYGIKKGLRGRFAMYVPPVLQVLGLAQVEHLPKNNRMRAR